MKVLNSNEIQAISGGAQSKTSLTPTTAIALGAVIVGAGALASHYSIPYSICLSAMGFTCTLINDPKTGLSIEFPRFGTA